VGCGMFQVCVYEVYGVEAICEYLSWFYIYGCEFEYVMYCC
jgi:hypothetical protein